MLKIAVVEDQQEVRDELCRFIRQYAAENSLQVEVLPIEDGAVIAEHYEPGYDIIFMDVEMPGLDGFGAAEKIRAVDADAVLVFVTNMAQYAIKGYEVDALDYVLKPVNYYQFCTKLSRAVQRVQRRRGGVQIDTLPALNAVHGLDYDYLYSADTLWRLQRASSARILPALQALCGKSLFFTSADATEFCSYVLPELGSKLTIVDPERLLLNQIPLEPVVQFYLDAPDSFRIEAHAEFLYGEDKVTPFVPSPAGLLRDVRAESRAKRLLASYLQPGVGGREEVYGTADEDEIYRMLEEGVPALLAEGEVYLTDAFRSLQAAPPRITVGVSVHGSVLDLEVDTGEFPVAELKDLLRSLHQKKRYHRLRDGRLLRLDDSLEGLDELNDTLELSGAKLKSGHAELPLYRAPSLDWALSGQNGLRFNRDDAFRRISRSFHAVKDSEYTPPESLHNVLRKYQRDGYRWLRTLDGYGMGGILADDMGLGKTLQVLSYLLAIKELGENPLPSLIVCPASLVLNWAEECEKFTPELHCVVVDGDAAHRAAEFPRQPDYLPDRSYPSSRNSEIPDHFPKKTD